MQLFEKECLACEYHGTGDTFDGVFVGAYLNNKSLEESLELAHAFVYACMKEINVSELKDNMFDAISKEWMLVTAGRIDHRKKSLYACIK